MHKFSLQLDPSPSAEIVDVHARSRLVLWYISKRLGITIYLFSSRSKARLFKAEGSNTSVGLFHHVDSFHGISEYLVLTTSRHRPKESMVVDARPSAEFKSEYPIAVHREGARPRVRQSRPVDSSITKEDCERALHMACDERLDKIVKDTIAYAAKARKLGPSQTREEYIKEERDKVYREQVGKDRLPQNVKPRAVEIIRREHGKSDEFSVADMDRIQRDASTNRTIWSETVKLRFNEIWDTAQSDTAEKSPSKAKKGKKRATATHGSQSGARDLDDNEGGQMISTHDIGSTVGPGKTDDDEQDDEDDTKNLRTCCATLRQLVRPDLYSHIQDIKEIIEDRQKAVTDDITELSILTHKTTLAIAAGELYHESQNEPSPKTFDLLALLPEGFEIRSEVPTTINVAPIPAGIQDTIEKALDKKPSSAYDRDLAHILSKEHLQHLHSTFLGSRGTYQGTKDGHPGWERGAADAIKDPSSFSPKAPEGLSTTIIEAIGEFSTEVGNLWNGSAYYKSVDYLGTIVGNTNGSIYKPRKLHYTTDHTPQEHAADRPYFDSSQQHYQPFGRRPARRETGRFFSNNVITNKADNDLGTPTTAGSTMARPSLSKEM
ncbi:hypothetical protein BGZ65_011219 [Modicella reniformis]|uniref:Uncharacterized protein n=1 Tax=Modicella reniformis TaxID=1440133 RepID=A0A9P6SNP6_9FUNG|nr:hypothetical protein BGZ65_011219 [Modicella reniformis]